MAIKLFFALCCCFMAFTACLVYAAPGFGERPSQDFDKELVKTLRELLGEEESKEEEAGMANSAGEYLGDAHNSHHREPHWEQKHNDAPVEDMTGGGERKEEEEEKEDERKERLQSLYSTLVGLYNRHHRHQENVLTEDSSFDQLPNADSSSHAYGAQTEEGRFGEFVDADHEVGPSDNKMRQSVLAAIEKRLQEDLRDARSVGISVDDLIQDLQHKASDARTAHLRHIEEELSRLSDRKD